MTHMYTHTHSQWAANCFEDKTHHLHHFNSTDLLYSDSHSHNASSHHEGICWSLWDIYAMILPVLIILTFLPSFRILAYSAYIGSVFLVLAVAVSSQYDAGPCVVLHHTPLHHAPLHHAPLHHAPLLVNLPWELALLCSVNEHHNAVEC